MACSENVFGKTLMTSVWLTHEKSVEITGFIRVQSSSVRQHRLSLTKGKYDRRSVAGTKAFAEGQLTL